MNFLVLGGCGYLGSLLIREYLPKEFPNSLIRIYDSMFKDRYVTLFDLPKEARYEVIYADVRNTEMLEQAFDGIDIVIYQADITNAPLSFERKELTEDVNYKGAMNAFRQAIKNKIEKFIYTSSASVYGPTDGIVDENFDCKPASPYGIFKLKAETEGMKLAREAGLNAVALRLGTVVGYSIGMRFDTILDVFSFQASIGKPLSVYNTALQEARPYVHIRDVCRAYIWAIKNNDVNGEIINIVSDNWNMTQVLDTIKKYIPDLKYEIVDTPSLNQLSYKLDDQKARKYGFLSEYTVEQGIEELLDKFKQIKRYNY
ncbi:MAG: NAD-dependent epimerase/dehydratase family protein [Candidatus Helarchaeota archaeon]